MKRICIQCTTEFSARGRRGLVAKFCSKVCKDKSQIGKPNKSSTKFKKGHTPWSKGTTGIVKAWNKGVHINLNPDYSFKKGSVSPNKGKKLLHLRGENASHWQGGKTKESKRIRNSTEYRDWRIAVFERDNYTCRECGSRGVTLNADHIKPFAYYPELRLRIENGRTLCVPCHKKTDTYASRAISMYASDGVIQLT